MDRLDLFDRAPLSCGFGELSLGEEFGPQSIRSTRDKRRDRGQLRDIVCQLDAFLSGPPLSYLLVHLNGDSLNLGLTQWPVRP